MFLAGVPGIAGYLLHRRWPVIVIWDDHEFSDDSWQTTATYFDGRMDEDDVERKRRAEQAFFEWVPIEIGSTPTA